MKSELIELLHIHQAALGNSREQCDEGGKKLWDRINVALVRLAAQPEMLSDPMWPTDCEIEAMLKNPVVLAALMMYHEMQQIQAESMMDPEDGLHDCLAASEKRIQGFKEKGRSIMAADLDIWTDDLRKEFGFPPAGKAVAA